MRPCPHHGQLAANLRLPCVLFGNLVTANRMQLGRLAMLLGGVIVIRSRLVVGVRSCFRGPSPKWSFVLVFTSPNLPLDKYIICIRKIHIPSTFIVIWNIILILL